MLSTKTNATDQSQIGTIKISHAKHRDIATLANKIGQVKKLPDLYVT